MDEEIETQKGDEGEVAEPLEETEEVVPATEEPEAVVEEAAETAMEEPEEMGEVTIAEEPEAAVEEAEEMALEEPEETGEAAVWTEEAGEEAYATDEGLEMLEEGEAEGVDEAAYDAFADVPLEAGVAAAEAWEMAAGEAIAEPAFAPEYPHLTFQDGFRFGCGFTIAGCLVWLAVPLLIGLLIVVLTALSAL